MSNAYSVKVGRGEEFIRARGVQQFEFTQQVEKTNPFTMYIDTGYLSDYIQMGMLVELYHYQERIFKGRILGFDDDDDGISISGNDMMVGFPNVFVDAQYPRYQYTDGYPLKTLIYDLMHKTSTKRHVDGIDAYTFVRPTDYSAWWTITDKPLLTFLKDTVPASLDPTSYRRNTFFLDPYDNFHVEPIGGSGIFKGAMDIQKRKMSAKADGNFCNYAVFRGARAVPEPVNRDAWTERDADNWDGDATESRVSGAIKNEWAIKQVQSSGAGGYLFYLKNGVSTKKYQDMRSCSFKIKFAAGGGNITFGSTYFMYYGEQDDGNLYQLKWYLDDNEQGLSTFSNDVWYDIRINDGELTEDIAGGGAMGGLGHIGFYIVSTGTYTVTIDNLYIERPEVIGTVSNLPSIKTFGLFEKRKRDPTLYYQADVNAAAAALLNPFPKMQYSVTTNGYVPIGLNQSIEVEWRNVDWILPLMQKKAVLKSGNTNSYLIFGGMPLSADDIPNAIAAELRKEAYGKYPRWKKSVGSGDDPENQESYTVDDGTGEPEYPLLPLEGYLGRSPSILAKQSEYMDWDDYNQYGG